MSTALVEKQQALDAARREAAEFYAANPTEKIAEDGDLRETAKSHNRKMADLHETVAALQEIEEGQKQANTKRESNGRAIDPEQPQARSHKAFDWDEAYEQSEGVARLKSLGGSFSGQIELVEIPSVKTLLTLSNLTPDPERRPAGLVASAQDETTVADLMLQGTTNSNVLNYYEETTFTNAAATVAEGDPKPESALAWTERTDAIRKIATWIPMTSEFMEDNAGVRSTVEGRLRFMLARAEENQLLNGDGTAPNISGILDRSIQTVASTNDIDALYRAITEIRVDGQAEPTAIVIHPLSYANIRLSKDSNNRYYGDGPFGALAADRLWGLPVRVTPLIAEGTALVGAFRPFATVFRKGGVRVVASTEHASYFIENKVALLVEERIGLQVTRASAFCTVTGLASS